MCTAIKHKGFFGRTLDFECAYSCKAVIMPRNFKFKYLYEESPVPHYAIMGIAHVETGMPLFFDAINEKGLGIAGLNFPNNAKYQPRTAGFLNVASFELIPFILSKCDSVDNAHNLLKSINITNDSFSSALPATPLHWLIADTDRAICVEMTKKGLEIYENPYEVLTNNPTFDYHINNLSSYMHLTPLPVNNTLCPDLELKAYSRGLGAVGLPGDYSSASRFVRTVFVKNHILETSNPVYDFFHILRTVSVPLGCIITDTGAPVSTIYTTCADLKGGKYYYSTYENPQISFFSFDNTNLNQNRLWCDNMLK